MGKMAAKKEALGHEPAKRTLRVMSPTDLLEREVSGHEPVNVILGAMSPVDLRERIVLPQVSEHDTGSGEPSNFIRGHRPMDTGRRQGGARHYLSRI